MAALRRALLMAGALFLVVFVAACGGSPTVNNGNNMNKGDMMGTTTTPMANDTMTATTPTTMQTMPATAPTMQPTMKPTMPQQNMNAQIHTTQVMLNGKAVMVLTNAKGFVLYYRMNDPAPRSGCTGMCAQAWPPVLAQNNMMTVTSSMKLPKKLTVFKTANGNQVLYDGHPLYTYAGDMNPGQFSGRGMDKVWYLVGTDL